MELAHLSEIYGVDEMAYITKMVRESREHVTSHNVEEAQRFAEIIKSEAHLSALAEPTSLTPEQIQEKLQAMKHLKK
jgi:hypothetical protein